MDFGLGDSFNNALNLAGPMFSGPGAALSLANGGLPDFGRMLGTKNGFIPDQTPGMMDQLTNAQGTYNQTVGDQTALAKALQLQSQGQGPNPAQAMLNQATNQNIAQNTGMIASQKGINPVLATRLASMNAANMSQQAAGQGATMSAQQQLGAQDKLAGLYNNMNNQSINQQQLAQQGLMNNNNLRAGVAQNNVNAGTQLLGAGASAAGSAMSGKAHGGQIGHHEQLTMVSPGEKYIEPQDVHNYADGDASLKDVGHKVPGKAKVKGDSKDNDTVPAKLEEGGIVIPRSHAKDPKKAHAFVDALLSKEKKKGVGFKDVIAARRGA